MCNKVLLVDLSNQETVHKALNVLYPNDIYKLGDKTLVIATDIDTDAKKVNKQLDFRQHQNLGTGLISELTYMTGYYDQGFLNWMSKRETSTHSVS